MKKKRIAPDAPNHPDSAWTTVPSADGGEQSGRGQPNVGCGDERTGEMALMAPADGSIASPATSPSISAGAHWFWVVNREFVTVSRVQGMDPTDDGWWIAR